MAADVVKGIWEAIQNLPAPELRGLGAEMRANTQRLKDVKGESREMKDGLRGELRELKTDFCEWRAGADRRFEHIEHRLDTYEDVQILKEQVAELRARQQPLA